jgi:hypothetical protein
MVKKKIGIVTGAQEEAKQEKELVNQIKPKLENFLINQQVSKAEETAKKSAEDSADMLRRMTKEQIVGQTSKLAMRAFLDLKLWQKQKPAIDMAWMTGQTLDGRKLSNNELQTELKADIAGFSSYLVREYFNMEKDIVKGKYPNPLIESNLVFFWEKFCGDMILLLKVNERLRKKDNAGLIIPNDTN